MISVYFSIFLALTAVVAILYLVLELKKANADLVTCRSELDRCQHTLELTEDVGRFGSWYLDHKANTVKWSDYIFDMHERRHSLGHPPLEKAIEYYHPDDRAIVQSAVDLAMEKGEDFEFRARIITENGNELPVLARGTCQFGGEGQVLGIFGCFVDLSTPQDRR